MWIEVQPPNAPKETMWFGAGGVIAEGVPADRHDVFRWYQEVWEGINGPGSWTANPWVWVVEFRRAADG